MDPVIIAVLIRDGIPAAMRVWQWIQEKKNPTQADWDALVADSRYYAADALAKAGVVIRDGKAYRLDGTLIELVP